MVFPFSPSSTPRPTPLVRRTGLGSQPPHQAVLPAYRDRDRGRRHHRRRGCALARPAEGDSRVHFHHALDARDSHRSGHSRSLRRDRRDEIRHLRRRIVRIILGRRKRRTRRGRSKSCEWRRICFKVERSLQIQHGRRGDVGVISTQSGELTTAADRRSTRGPTSTCVRGFLGP